MNNELVDDGLSPGGSTHVFIVWWDSRALSDQTDLTKGRDDS